MATRTVLKYLAVLFILFLSAFNLHYYSESEKVLGTSIENLNKDKEAQFWNNFLEEHPTYIPGLIETNRLDKVKEVDPNYFIIP